VQGIETAGHVSHRRASRVSHEHASTTRPAGVLSGIGWGDQVPLNGSGLMLLSAEPKG